MKSRNKKIHKQQGETTISGVEYEKRLREQHRCDNEAMKHRSLQRHQQQPDAAAGIRLGIVHLLLSRANVTTLCSACSDLFYLQEAQPRSQLGAGAKGGAGGGCGG